MTLVEASIGEFSVRTLPRASYVQVVVDVVETSIGRVWLSRFESASNVLDVVRPAGLTNEVTRARESIV